MTKSCDVMKVESRTYLLSDKMSEWIFSDYPGKFRQEKEKVPESILFALKAKSVKSELESEVEIFDGTFENDRALFLAKYLPVASEEDLKDVEVQDVFYFHDY